MNICPDTLMKIVEYRAIGVDDNNDTKRKRDISCKKICSNRVRGDA